MELTLEKAVVQIFRTQRNTLKKSQEDISILVGTSSKTIYRLESHYTPLSFDLFVKLCNVYQLDPSLVLNLAKATISPIENTPII